MLYSSHDLVKNSSYPNRKMKAKILKECLGLILNKRLGLVSKRVLYSAKDLCCQVFTLLINTGDTRSSESTVPVSCLSNYLGFDA